MRQNLKDLVFGRVIFCIKEHTVCFWGPLSIRLLWSHIHILVDSSFPLHLSDYCIGSNFGKFYLIRTDFTWGELVSWVKVFRLFRLELIFLVFRVWTQYGRCTTSCLLAGPACLWCLVLSSCAHSHLTTLQVKLVLRSHPLTR